MKKTALNGGSFIMHRLLTGFVFVSLSLLACTVQNTEKGTGPSGSSTDGGTTSSSSSSSSGGSSSGGQTSTDKPPVSTTGATVDIDGQCSAFAACGGNPQGTYDYTGGCIEDVFAGARSACPALDTTKAVVSVKGSIWFVGNALERDVTVTTSGAITFPASCTYGQCAMIESELKSAFDSVSCSGSTDCTCTVSNVQTEKDATTYTVEGTTLTTADGDTYSICEKGSELAYSGKSAGSEQGSFTLKRR